MKLTIFAIVFPLRFLWWNVAFAPCTYSFIHKIKISHTHCRWDNPATFNISPIRFGPSAQLWCKSVQRKAQQQRFTCMIYETST
jgi:hypothetical protein